MKKFKTIMIVLLSIWIINIHFAYIFANNKGLIMENHVLKEEINNDTNFALMLEQNDGTYIESTSSKWPDNYSLNLDKSKCIDKNGNELNKDLKYINNVIKITTNTTSYCYLYFDIVKTDTEKLMENVSSEMLWDSTLEDDGYRYVGTNPDNYICFGTTDKKECISDTDKYMYRIIGIFEGTDGKQHLKLIKKEALNTTYAWHSSNADVDWDESDLYKGLNGSYFVNNPTYSYMQNSTWLNKIETWDYVATNTKSYESAGPNYYNDLTAQNVYLHEMNRSSKTKNVGEWKTVSGKISLMYASDYLLSLGSSALEYTSYTNRKTLKTGWMHLSNNDSLASIGNEWTSTRSGRSMYGGAYVWYVSTNGDVGKDQVNDMNSVRPVFYLTEDIIFESGTGKNNDPYIIYQEPIDTEKLIENVSSEMLWDSTLEDDGYRYVGTNPDNYICFGTTDKEDCTTNTNKYMYRIIGVFPDEEGKQHMKLIKKEALNTGYVWHSSNADVDWDESDLYKGLNGDYFLDNPTYSYMQNNVWLNKIETWSYTATNTKTRENDSSNVYGLYYSYNIVKTVYLHELNRSSKTSQTCYFNTGTTTDCSVGEWTPVLSKVSLMYASDYLLSLGSNVLNSSINSNFSSLRTGWMHISNNESDVYQSEWTSTRFGAVSDGRYLAWHVFSDGRVGFNSVYDTISVRPVFYLKSDVKISGEGTINDPYIINY